MSFAALLLAFAPGSQPGENPPPSDYSPGGYLYQPAFSVDYELRQPVRPYVPQPGDIYLATEDWFIARAGHTIVYSGAPHHSGIVVAMPDGSMALLEGGPDSTLYLRVLDLMPRLDHYYQTKRVWIRQRCVPLTPEQSYRLTAFALAAKDRHFAAVRMVKENSFMHAKGRIRTRLFGHPHAANFDPQNPEPGMRKKYFCSELVTEACVAAWLLPADTSRPTSMYPREWFFGSSRIPYIRNNLDMSAWYPPARWTPLPGTEPYIRKMPFIDGDANSIRRSP